MISASNAKTATPVILALESADGMKTIQKNQLAGAIHEDLLDLIALTDETACASPMLKVLAVTFAVQELSHYKKTIHRAVYNVTVQDLRMNVRQPICTDCVLMLKPPLEITDSL